MTTTTFFRLLSVFALVFMFSLPSAVAGPGRRAASSTTPRHLRLHLSPRKAHSATLLTGSVLGPDGMPLAGAWVSVEGQPVRVRTNAYGDFTLSLSSNGPVVVNCTARGYARQSLSLATASQPTDIYFALQPVTSAGMLALERP